MEYTPYTLPLMGATAIALGLALFALRYRDVPGRTAFVLLMLAVAAWSAGYALEISSTAFATKVFWAKVQYLGIAPLPLLWLGFVVQYAGESPRLGAGRTAMLAAPALGALVLVWFNDRLQLIWEGLAVNRSLGFAMLVFDYGPAFWAFAAYSYVLLLLGALVLLRAILRLPRLGSRQGLVILVAALAPWAGNALYLSGASPFPLLDLTPFSFTLTGLALAWGMGRFRFLGTLPVAHRAIIEGMQAGVAALDSADNVVALNPAAERMFDVRAETATGRPVAEAFARQPDVLEWLTAPRETTIRGTLYTRGARRDFDVRIKLLYDGRRHAGRLITFHDISALAFAEREAEEAQKVAEDANRAKSEFLANVSHEIRTPLNAIIGMTELALEGELREQQREYLEVVRSSAGSLLAVINDILDFSKIEMRKLDLDRIPFDLHRLVQASIRMLAVTVAGKPIELHASLDPAVPQVVAGDPLRLRQVLLNLLSNAIKFTDEGEVRVTVMPVDDPGLAPDQCRLAFAVADTGIGIGLQDRRRIFESFAQADASTTRIYGGTGLGLSIASHLIALMHGGIEVDSEVGRGSTFHFSIVVERSDVDPAALAPMQPARRPGARPPAVQATASGGGAAGPAAGGGQPATDDRAAPPPEDRPAPSQPPGLRVLVADDNLINQRLGRALLESRGHVATVVNDGQEAVAALAEGTFDVVLMDVQMPRLDGIDATRAIRAAEAFSGRHVPIIAITAHAMTGDRERFLEAGMDAYVPKPLDAALLFETIEQVLQDGAAAAVDGDGGAEAGG